jgi:hypothetical protein|tara:strand:- start:5339 stop:5539 length:201 start_codon:yes stop_codon:yes gene_type:complete
MASKDFVSLLIKYVRDKGPNDRPVTTRSASKYIHIQSFLQILEGMGVGLSTTLMVVAALLLLIMAL